MSELKKTDIVETTEGLIANIAWDDDESPEKALAPGVYKTSGGEWRHEGGEKWRFWCAEGFMIPGIHIKSENKS